MQQYITGVVPLYRWYCNGCLGGGEPPRALESYLGTAAVYTAVPGLSVCTGTQQILVYTYNMIPYILDYTPRWDACQSDVRIT